MQVALELATAGHFVRAIPEELNQVLRSLIQNACEAVGPGGQVKVRTRAEGAQLVLEVTDNGPGIAPDDLAKNFSPFFSTKPGSGRGLGLPIVQIVVARAGGTVEVNSVPKVETMFRVTLPVPRRRPTSPGPPAAIAPVRAAPRAPAQSFCLNDSGSSLYRWHHR